MKKFLALAALLTLSVGETPPLVYLPTLGKIRGGFGKSLNGRSFFSFEGVPFAHPPTGEFRFKEPQPPKPWNDIWEAKTRFRCMQHNPDFPSIDDFVTGDEDCLYLNIYTPALEHKLDVIVYIHGGAFMADWEGYQGPDYLLDKDVVFVTLNYRLGPLGFLSTEDDVLPGNNGMKDQIFALQWIKKYIRYFGGNPDAITIMGMSAGGASVHFHYLSPKSTGLFHRGFSQSGSMLCSWALTENSLEKSKKLAKSLGCVTDDTKKMVKCLKEKPARQIVASVKDFQPWFHNPFAPFGIVIDSWASDPVLPEHPYILLKKKKVYDVPWIGSYTNAEGLYPAAYFYADEQLLLDIDKRWNEIIPLILDYNSTVNPELLDEVSQKIRNHYFHNKEVSRRTFMDLISTFSDRIFITDIQKALRLQAAATKSPVYSYYFTYRGAHSRSEHITHSAQNFHASHGDDTCYICKDKNVDTTTTSSDREMIDMFLRWLTAFAKTGKPDLHVEWPQIPKNLHKPYTYLKIDSPDKISTETGISKNTEFWNSLPIQENEKLFATAKDEL